MLESFVAHEEDLSNSIFSHLLFNSIAVGLFRFENVRGMNRKETCLIN